MEFEQDKHQQVNTQSSRTNWARVDAMTDETIDTSDIPPLTDAFFARATWRIGDYNEHLIPEHYYD